jgi:hypothetical protein
MIIIQTSKGNRAIIDDEDFEWVSKHSWFDVGGYANSHFRTENGKYKQVQMHRIIMNVPEGKFVDHINGDRSDNRRENLRIATHVQNMWNSGKKNKETATSKYKGVVRSKWGKFQIRIAHDGIRERLGSFDNEIAAANAFNYYAKIFFGEFARLNEVPFMEKEEWEKHKTIASSEFKGISWAKDRGKWAVSIYNPKLKRNKNVGYFDDEILAANYYNHLMGEEVNQCDYFSLEECEDYKCKRKKVSKYNGVSWFKRDNKWDAIIYHDGQRYKVGRFDTETEAALAYNEKAIEIKGNNTKLNVIGNENND